MRTAKIRAILGGALLLLSVLASASATQTMSIPSEHPNPQRISVQTQGSGPDVILIPGLASSRDIWAGLAATLRKNHRVHLVELAGFAGTPAISSPQGKVIASAVDALADYIQSQNIQAPAIEMALMLGARHPDQVGRLMIVDALPFYTLMIDPAATTETSARHAAAMRDLLLRQSPEQLTEFQTASINRLVKNGAVKPALVTAGINSDRKTVADAVYELMITDLRPELASKHRLRSCTRMMPYTGSRQPAWMRCTVKPTLLLPTSISRGSMTVFTLSCWISQNDLPPRLSHF
ncbi:alpha/beta hydrolase [Enterobacter sp.]|uniref:alpha/beta fold hydrolase n=1 Tax=Enterobacter sp. TaxID=42895 RepID=UPI00296FCFBD|nr:alpha/beta hydrolase [Enterobacter sp.]